VTCRECSEFLSDYLEGALPDAVRDTFEVHLSRCPNCVTYLEQLRTAIRAGQLAFADSCDEDTQLPEELIRAILEARKNQK
jgi:anti-sigma factor RsiW